MITGGVAVAFTIFQRPNLTIVSLSTPAWSVRIALTHVTLGSVADRRDNNSGIFYWKLKEIWEAK